MEQSPSSGGMPTQDTATTVEICDSAYWPDEAVLTDFVEQNAQAAKDDRAEQADAPLEDSPQYATLYFVS